MNDSRAKRWFDHPLVQLTLVRIREFIREPDAVFWVLLFPILMAAGLGLAFRSRPQEVLRIAAVTPTIARALRADKLLDALVRRSWPPEKRALSP